MGNETFLKNPYFPNIQIRLLLIHTYLLLIKVAKWLVLTLDTVHTRMYSSFDPTCIPSLLQSTRDNQNLFTPPHNAVSIFLRLLVQRTVDVKEHGKLLQTAAIMMSHR
jgi:hypothetical protein